MSTPKDLHNRWLKTRNRSQEDVDYRDEWWAEQCGMCQHWAPLSGDVGLDFGACTSADSNFDGQVRFEHDGCTEHLAAESWRLPTSTRRMRDDALVALVSALLYAFDPDGMGSTVGAPEDEYDDPGRSLVRGLRESGDAASVLRSHYQDALEALVTAVSAVHRVASRADRAS